MPKKEINFMRNVSYKQIMICLLSIIILNTIATKNGMLYYLLEMCCDNRCYPDKDQISFSHCKSKCVHFSLL